MTMAIKVIAAVASLISIPIYYLLKVPVEITRPNLKRDVIPLHSPKWKFWNHWSACNLPYLPFV
jgi:hypothetical protein